jgi:hypothetical protein
MIVAPCGEAVHRSSPGSSLSRRDATSGIMSYALSNFGINQILYRIEAEQPCFRVGRALRLFFKLPPNLFEGHRNTVGQ